MVGLDAMNPDLLERWCDDGSLPHLARLRARGCFARTEGIEGFYVGSTWPSFYTATTPARHGIHYLVQLDPGTYRFHRPAEGGFVRTDPFWKALGNRGRRLAILDVPLTGLDPGIDGIQTVEWGGHDSIYGFGAQPPQLAAEIEARFGLHPVGPSCDARRSSAADYRALLDRLLRGVAAKTALTQWVLAKERWDLVIQVFTEAHCVGHQCWHLHDPTHPEHDPAMIAELGDPLLAVYGAIDEAIGALLAAAPDARILVFSAHGMKHWFGAQFLLPGILARLGVAAPAPARPRGVSDPMVDRARDLWRRLPDPVRTILAPLRRVVRLERGNPSGLPTLGVDPRSSRCFAVGNGQAVGGIRLNLIGREPEGILEPGDGARAFSRELIADLLAIEDCRTGRSLVRRVIRTADRYQGPQLDALPDLLVEWSDEVATGSTSVGRGTGATVRARSPKIGEIEGTNDYGRTGEHRPGGFLIAAGRGIEARRIDSVPLIDIAPTIARWFGETLPDVDGREIPALALPL